MCASHVERDRRSHEQEDPEWTAEKELCMRRGMPYTAPKQKENVDVRSRHADHIYLASPISVHLQGFCVLQASCARAEWLTVRARMTSIRRQRRAACMRATAARWTPAPREAPSGAVHMKAVHSTALMLYDKRTHGSCGAWCLHLHAHQAWLHDALACRSTSRHPCMLLRQVCGQDRGPADGVLGGRAL